MDSQNPFAGVEAAVNSIAQALSLASTLGHNLDWTPTLTNLSGGTLNYAQAAKVGGNVFFSFKYTLAGAGVGGAVTISSPYEILYTPEAGGYSGVLIETIGYGSLRDDSAATTRPAVALVSDANTIGIRRLADTTGNYGALSSTAPFTWAANDFIQIEGRYATPV